MNIEEYNDVHGFEPYYVYKKWLNIDHHDLHVDISMKFCLNFDDDNDDDDFNKKDEMMIIIMTIKIPGCFKESALVKLSRQDRSLSTGASFQHDDDDDGYGDDYDDAYLIRQSAPMIFWRKIINSKIVILLFSILMIFFFIFFVHTSDNLHGGKG